MALTKILGGALAFALAHGETALQKVAEWDVKNVATLNLAYDLPGLPGQSLVGTTFGPFGKDDVFALGPLSAGQGANVTTLSEQFSWPNEAYEVPADVKAKANLTGSVIAVADGFIFPLKQTGGIHLLQVADGLTVSATTISEVKHAWFYHHSEWMDVDMDGVMDVIAARSIKPFLRGHVDSELVWFKNNGNGTWGKTQVITKGPGVGFKAVDIDGDGKMEIIATEFFLYQQLAIYSCPETSWAKCADKSNVVATVVDANDGPYFQCSWVDLNSDGKMDILATAQQQTVDGKVIPGKVLAFEQPASWTPGDTKWTRHVLADGYLPQPKQPSGSGAPGIPVAFHMTTNSSEKPLIVLSGDDGGVVDLLTPASRSQSDWTYTKETLYTSHTSTSQGVNTIGSVLVAPATKSEGPLLFIPSYAESKLLMYKFASTSMVIV
jgi:hypothetical protein